MRQQALRYGVAGAVGLVLVVALVLMANWLGARHYQRMDWTSTKLYSLSDKSLNLIRGLDEDIHVMVFVVPGGPLYDQVRELLARYEAASDRIEVEYIDYEKEPLKTRELAEELGVSMADTVVFMAGERKKHVTADQMVEYDYSGMQYGQQPTVRAFTGEEQFTSAILSLVASDVLRIYFVTGHGEVPLDRGGTGILAERSLAVLVDALRRENIEIEEISLLVSEIPDDADVIAIVGPTEAYTEAELSALGSYLEGGGRMLVALDPLIEPDGTMSFTRLEGFLGNHGVIVNNDLVVDPSRQLQGVGLEIFSLTEFADHPVTGGLEGIAALFMISRSLMPDGDDAEVLAETTTDGWGETDLGMLLRGEPVVFDDDVDTPGPAAVAVAVESPGVAAPSSGEDPAAAAVREEDLASRLVVFGDSDFLTDGPIASVGNESLALNSFNWLAARELSMGIPPRDVQELAFHISDRQMKIVAVVVLLVMPGAAIAVGMMVWRRRKH